MERIFVRRMIFACICVIMLFVLGGICASSLSCGGADPDPISVEDREYKYEMYVGKEVITTWVANGFPTTFRTVGDVKFYSKETGSGIEIIGVSENVTLVVTRIK